MCGVSTARYDRLSNACVCRDCCGFPGGPVVPHVPMLERESTLQKLADAKKDAEAYIKSRVAPE
jgi:hypothetical protein